jgi:GT2 family glycosyltransferase
MDNISIIIPAYYANPELVDMTKRCLDSIRGINEIIVVNDGSPLNAEFDTIRLPENQGYASAVNVGLEASTGDFIIISNNDIVFIDPTWLEELIKPLKEGYGISTIRTSEPDGWKTEDRYEENAKFGSLWAIRRDTYETLGSLDERFGKGYGEDLDYWHRARNAGIRIVKNHNALAEHLGKATFKITDPNDKSFNEFLFAYHKKWPTEHKIFLFGGNQVIGFNKWELEDMSYDDKKHYAQEEISLEELEKIWKRSTS